MEIRLRPEFRCLPSRGESQMHVLATFTGTAPPKMELRPPISLCLVVDRSLSMNGEKINQTKQAIIQLITMLTRRDRVGIVMFNDKVDVLAPLTRLTDKQRIIRNVETITASGYTNLSGGWLMGLGMLQEDFDPEHITRILLLTDGQANVGFTNDEQLIEISRNFVERRIPTTCFGVGQDFNEQLLKGITEECGSNYYFIKDSTDSEQNTNSVAEAFNTEFGELSNLLGQNLEVKLRLTKGVSLMEDLSPYRSRKHNGSYIYSLGDLNDGFEKKVLFRVHLDNTFDSGRRKLLDLSTSYNSMPDNYALKKDNYSFRFRFEKDTKNNGGHVNHDVLDEVLIAKTIIAKQDALKEIEAGNFDKALDLIEDRCMLIRDRLDSADGPVNHEALQVELNLLTELHMKIKNRRTNLGKTITSQVEEYGKSRGVYRHARKCKSFILKQSFSPRDTKLVEDALTELDVELLSLGIEKDFLNRCKLCLAELLNNALEHGCQNDPDGVVKVKAVFSRSNCVIEVLDPGPGFDVDEVLKRAQTLTGKKRKIKIWDRTMQSGNRTVQNNLLSRRGRGIALLLLETNGLVYNKEGNHVTATLFNKPGKGVVSPDNSMTRKGKAAVIKCDRLTKQFKIRTVHSQVMAEISLAGQLDMYTLPSIRPRLFELSQKEIKYLLLNLMHLDYVDSTGLGMIIGLNKKIRDFGGEMTIALGDNSYVMKLFNNINLDQIIMLLSTPEEARQYLEGKMET